MQNCKDINNNDVIDIILNEDGTVTGLISDVVDPDEAIGVDVRNKTTYENKDDLNVGGLRDTSSSSLSQECCENLGFEFDNNTCYWSRPCDNDTTNILLFENNSYLYSVEENEDCNLNVKFDYLINIDCDKFIECYYSNKSEIENQIQLIELEIDEIITQINDLTSEFEELNCSIILNNDVNTAENFNNCQNLVGEINQLQDILNGLIQSRDDLTTELNNVLIGLIQSININYTINVIGNNQNVIQYNNNFFNIENFINLIQNGEGTGLYLTGDNCKQFKNILISELEENCEFLTDSKLDSQWLTYNETITNAGVLSGLTNQEILIGVQLVNPICETTILLDNIELNKNCVKRDYDKKLIQKCPGFEIEKVVDNTKSWLDADINRLNLLNGRETNYETNDDRLIINSKELILDVNISRAIETDLFNYIKKNDCLLDPCSYNTGLTICNKIKSSICITSGGTTEPIEEPTCENNNLITNGDFDTDLSGWDVFNFIWLSGEAVYSGSDEGGYLIQSVFEEGKTYKISFNLYMEGVEREPTASDVFVRYGNDIIKSYNHNGWLLIEEELTITAGNDLGFVFSDDGGLGFVYALDDVCVVEVIDNEPTSGSTSGTTCGDTGEDIKLFLSKLLNDVITVKEFNSLIYTDLIDVKSRKTISMYPVLKLLYERYLDSDLYCDVVSSKFSYLSMIDFTKLVGNYWVDLIEQVVPATSMWGSVYVYSNTVFDSQKFIYKKHRLFTCSKPNIDVIGVEGESQTDVVKITIDNNSEENQNCIVDDDNRETCNGVYQLQGTDGSEFIGTYKIIGSEEEDDVDFDSEEELVVIEEDNEEKPTAPPSDSTPPLSRPPDEWNPERS